MKLRTLGSGNNGFDISEVGLGTWQIGADWGKAFSEDKAFEILTAAVESGINFFDTADVYGNGQSESFIGEFLKHTNKTVRVATKFGRGADVYPASYSKDAMRNAIENSLTRLDVDALDLLQLHCIPTSEMQKGEVFDWLRDFKAEGLIRTFGASVESVEEGLLCMQQEGLQSLQIIFNIFRQKLLTELLPEAEAKGVGLIVRLPLASGLLSGKFTKQTQFDEKDHRNFNRDGQAFNVGETFAGLPFEKGVELADALKRELPAEMTLAQLALRWILDHKAVTSIIPGASSPQQAINNAKVSNLAPLPKNLHDKLYRFYQAEVHPAIRGVY
ncbi:aldo/keto reductase [Shewanella sp. Isolate11]|uniref:aldo/keto reductase n=1 Tax=Shewanella sp. Isolate11 TaxID=2908530 RepID=UPI001EFD3455|nr:aldo/keto reductase [Shewanella sp. Isolate11]MCG9698267.1 aldo/keto reductase [Shewanella sp. Isolate11]